MEKRPVSAVSDLDKNCYAVVMDAEVDEAAVQRSEKLEANYLVGKKRNETASSSELVILTKDEL